MHKKRIYIDTSVIGGCFDEEFAEWSNLLFQEFIEGKKIAVISITNLKELEGAPEKVKARLKEIMNNFIEIIEITEEIIELSELYISSGVLNPKSKEDALHIAAATISNVDVIVSWNFKHIVNIDKIAKYNSINLFKGYKYIDIRTPLEVITYEE